MVKNLPASVGDESLSLGLEDALEKEIANISLFLSGKSHGQRGLAWLWSMGSQRVGHDFATMQQQPTISRGTEKAESSGVSAVTFDWSVASCSWEL